MKFSLRNFSLNNQTVEQVNANLEQAHALYNAEHARQVAMFQRRYGQRPHSQQDAGIVHQNTLRALSAATRRDLGE